MDILTTKTETTGQRPLMLTRFGNVVTCPFATKIPLMEGNISKQLRIEAQPCWELCPHFNVIETEYKHSLVVELTCSGEQHLIEVHINNTTKPQENTIFPAT